VATNHAATGLQNRFPLIRNIRVEPEPEFPHSVRVRWDVDPANDTAIYVGRYIRPLATRELVLEAENLTSPPLGPRETSYVDRNIPDGAYYYVVVTSFEMSKRDSVVLTPNVNYTSTPSIIYRDGSQRDDPRRGSDGRDVTNLYAVNSGSSVKLSWRPPNRGNVRYSVYRSEAPLDTPAALESASRLAVLSGNQYTFEDRNPILNRRVYYGVSVTDIATGREDRQLYEQRSFVGHVFGKQEFSDSQLVGLPDALTAFIASKDTVRLLWVDSGQPMSDYRIYRANRPISSEAALREAALIGTERPGANGFRDSGLLPGTYYYAVLPRDTGGREIRLFVEGRTFTGFAVNIGGNQTIADEERREQQDKKKQPGTLNDDERKALQEPTLEYLQAQGGPDSVELRWRIARPDLRDFQMLVFRGKKALRTVKEVREWGSLAATLPTGARTYTDVGLEPGSYYYALVLDFSDHVQEPLIAGRNYLETPVVVGGRVIDGNQDTEIVRPGPEFDGSLYELNRILALTYHKKRYGEAIRRLAPFVESDQLASNVRAKALLYTGLSLYHTGQYRSSLDYFVQDTVRENYPERADFWYNRSIKRLR
jgi:hypothetical protein